MECLPVSGIEAWLDCLMTAVENEMDDESKSIVADVLRVGIGPSDFGRESKSTYEFYQNVGEVLRILEYKAKKKWYNHIQIESEQRQQLLGLQNEHMHDYV